MHHLKVILIPLLKNISSEILHADVVVTEWWSITKSSQIAEQIEVIPELVLSEVSKLIDSRWTRDKETKGNSFLEEKGLHEIENGFTINKHT